MNKNKLILVLRIFALIVSLYSCKKTEFYCISEQISFFETTKNESSPNEIGQTEVPLLKKTLYFPQNCYTRLVIVLDSCDKVYVYQTETTVNKHFKIDSDSIKYSNYIGLTPEHLMTFRSTNFINFIRDNHDIFELDSIRNDTTIRFITVASNQDIIKNKVFYDLKDIVSMQLLGSGPAPDLFPIESNSKAFNSICVVRRTTEEENAVIYHKNKNLKYHPETLKWSNNFINGKCRPFSKGYDYIEKDIETKQKAIFGIKKLSMKITYFM